MRGLRTFLAMTLTLSFGAARAELTPAQRCAAAKERAAGKALAVRLACHVDALASGKAVRGACLRSSRRQLATTFALLGARCPGAASSVGTLIDDFCVSRLVGDLTGTGQCP